MPINATQVKNIKPASKTKRYFDGKGMYLEVTPNGGKYWRLKYRINGKEKRMSLGVYPDVSLKEARDKRDEQRKLISKGINPTEVRKAEKASNLENGANTFEVVAREWFNLQSKGWADTYSSKVIRRFEMYIFPWLGNKPITDIKAADLLPAVRKIEGRGKIESARRTLMHCGQVFRYAVATGRAEDDPSTALRGALAPSQHTHFAAVTDPEKVGPILRMLDGFQGTEVVQAALKLAPLVFVRPGELRQAQWSDINLEAAEWCFVASKTKQDHVVPLSRQAVQILKDLQPTTGYGQYVFPNPRNPKPDEPEPNRLN